MEKQMRLQNQDIYGEMPVRNNQGELCLDDSERMKAWVELYKGLLNVEFPWDEGALPDAPPVEGPPPPITDKMVTKALAKMKSGKSAGPSGIIVEMLKAAGSKGINFLRELIISVVKHGKIPDDWEMSFILNLYKGKGDALNRGNYRGLKLAEHVMKVMERIVDGMIREMIAIDEMQFAFALDEVQLMLYSSFGSSRRNSCPGKISMTRTWLCSSLLLTWRKRLTMSPERSCGGLWERWGSKSG